MGARKRDDLVDILAAVVFLGIVHILARELARTKRDRSAQKLDLISRVIDIVLGIDAVPKIASDARERIAINGAAHVPDMKRTCRIGANIFKQNFLRHSGGIPHLIAI